jgi:hypothetical protein
MSALRTIAGIFLLVVAASCSKPQANEVPGRYRANRGYGVEVLWLRAEDTYEQVFTSATTSRTNVGRWKLVGDSLFLYDALVFDDGWGHQVSLVKTCAWGLHVEKFAGQISLTYSESEPFEKQKP